MKNKNVAAFCVGTAAFVSLILFSREFTAGFSAGLSLCAEIAIPSMFPFLVAASLTGAGKLPESLKKIAEPASRAVFRLPADCLPAIAVGLFGGFLSGVKSADALYRSGSLSRSQARRLAYFCFGPGAGFSITALGGALLGSRKIGAAILFSVCLSSLLLGFASGFFPDDKTTGAGGPPRAEGGLPVALVDSVVSSARATLTACAFICIFSGISAILKKFIAAPAPLAFVSCVLEIASGCVLAADKASAPLLAAACSFGGLCVWLQASALSEKLDIKPLKFLAFRLLHAVLSFAVCSAVLRAVPIEEPVCATLCKNVAPFSFSAPASVSLLFLSALLILDLDNGGETC